ncbi:MAG: glycosyltransferase family 25 protein [Snodgrassella sp.]|uniref:glycosyltransferase family 25 protein n=1 Tax=Snodgrassella sp. TaxID=2815304 RepID=UPI00258971A4|nr:glycosyltransferase family 25 protein [Snodgrassella sp.]MCO6521367.1 glycosyltransferase family 25 protein [Snodgrassella sp.]
MLKTFLINLDRRPDRLMFVKEQLENLDIDFKRVSAIDGNCLTDEQKAVFDQQRFALECKRKLVVGEIGCALSHQKVWQQMVAENIPYALILEDDVQLKPELASLLADVRNYESFDFLNLTLKKPFYDVDATVVNSFVNKHHVVRPRFWQLFKRRSWRSMERKAIVKWKIFRLHTLSNGMTACECDIAPSLACCYIVSLQGAKSMLLASKTLFYPIDKVWHYCGGQLKEAFLVEPLAFQSLDSDISHRVRFRLTLKQKFKRFFVKGRHWQRQLDVMRIYGWTRL